MELKKFIQKNKERYIKDLSEFVSFKSISTDAKFKKEMNNCAEWTLKRLIKAGLKNVKRIKTKGHDIIYAELMASQNKKTLMIYGHYDVQPPDPLDEWKSDPFKLTVRGKKMYGRGACDNKGPCLSLIQGIEALLKENKKLPLNIKFVLEGEEEVGSVSFPEALSKNKKLFNSDFALVADGVRPFSSPTIEYGLRGLNCFEVEVKTLSQDVHSGGFGGVVDNPAIVLAHIISKLKDRNGKVLIPGIYNKVRSIDKKELKVLLEDETSDEEILQNTGAKKVFGEKGLLNAVRKGARPTLDVNGMWSGFTGVGTKTIIPAKAAAKISMRLVPNLKAKEVMNKTSKYIKKICPDTSEVNVKVFSILDPTLFDISLPIFKIGMKSLKEVFKREPKFNLVGGSIGAVDAMDKILGIEVFSTGFCLPDCSMHSPNENFTIDNFIKGTEFTAKFTLELGK